MTTRFQWWLGRAVRKTWVRAVAYGALGIVTALAALVIKPWLPETLGDRIGAEAVDQILNILATSMLAVTTFSVSIMLSAFTSAASGATPRATELLKQDSTTQQVLATFVGAFLFALVGIVALKAGVYGGRGRLVLFIATIAVLVAVVVALLRWIAHLVEFGRLGDTLDRVEQATSLALAARLEAPFLGGHPFRGAPPPDTVPVMARETGYVEHVDMSELDAIAGDISSDIWLAAMPGSFVHPAATLVWVHGSDPATQDRIRQAFSIGQARTFDQDPRFGLIVLTEAASRALSPAVNDPGTAIEVLGRLVRVLSIWTDPAEADLHWHRLHVPPVRVTDLMDDAFRPIARDGAGLVEVQIRLHKALLALAGMAPEVYARAAAAHSASALDRARLAGLRDDELAQVAAVSQQVATRAEGLPRGQPGV